MSKHNDLVDAMFSSNTKGFSYPRFAEENAVDTTEEFWEFCKTYYKSTPEQQIILKNDKKNYAHTWKFAFLDKIQKEQSAEQKQEPRKRRY